MQTKTAAGERCEICGKSATHRFEVSGHERPYCRKHYLNLCRANRIEPDGLAPVRAAPEHPAEPKLGRRAAQHRARWIGIAAGGAGIVILIAVLAAAFGGSNGRKSGSASGNKKPVISDAQSHATSYIADHGLDAYRLRTNVLNVQVALGEFVKSPTEANLNQLAQEAQTAHDNLDDIRVALADGNASGSLGDAETFAFGGANDFKNAMGALVAYTGNPNPATLASFTSQYTRAKSEWNPSVRTIWRMAHHGYPPVVR